MNHLFKKTLLWASGILVAFLIIFFFLILPSLKKPTPPSLDTTVPTPVPQPTMVYPTVIKNVLDQGQADENFGNAIKNSREPYPWYSALPLQTNDYFAYFDIPQRKFVGKIYSSSNNLSEEQIANIKTEIQTKLATLGVNPGQYPIEWQIGL